MTAACHEPAPPVSLATAPALRLLVVGNPNVGKTTLVNALAGTNLRVGNWSGVTVEKREALLRHGGKSIALTDLPGAYSLSPRTPEELITRSALISEAPDAIVNVLDAGNLERNLYLTLQLLEFGLPMVVALNLMDEAGAKGVTLDPAALEAALGLPVVPMVASTGQGVSDLLERVTAAARPGSQRGSASAADLIAGPCDPRLPDGPLPSARAEVLAAASSLTAFAAGRKGIAPHSARYLALALLEEDPSLRGRLLATGQAPLLEQADAALRSLRAAGIEPLLEIAEERYERAREIAARAVRDFHPRRTLTDRLDGLLLHRYLGIPAFLLIVLLVFRLTFLVAGPFVDLIGGPLQEVTAGWAAGALSAPFLPGFLRGLVGGAIIPGVGTVLSFLPTLLVLYLAMSFLEDSGYMARAAFLADRTMRGFGLDGKAFIPMILGFGCNVPAIYATRTLERPQDRVLVSLVLPFMSCSARLPVYVVFGAALFPRAGTFLVWGLYLLGMSVAVLVAYLLRRTLLAADGGSSILELPPYRLPRLSVMWKHAAEHTRAFARRAGGVVLWAVVAVWALLAIPVRPGHAFSQVPVGESAFGTVSSLIAPAFAPLGFDSWQAAGALIPGFVAKEVVVGTLGQIYLGEQTASAEPLGFLEGAGQLAAATWEAVVAAASTLPLVLAPPSLAAGDAPDPASGGLVAALKDAFTPAGTLAYLVFVLLYTPCIATVGAIAAEHGRKLAWLTVGYQLATAWLLGMATYQVARYIL
ncbi:MAG TPA: ferrous iron transport protein B [Deinococcales bacterium]|nr:ferrous iron transport protein B [Deinococcales bacterium]